MHLMNVDKGPRRTKAAVSEEERDSMDSLSLSMEINYAQGSRPIVYSRLGDALGIDDPCHLRRGRMPWASLPKATLSTLLSSVLAPLVETLLSENILQMTTITLAQTQDGGLRGLEGLPHRLEEGLPILMTNLSRHGLPEAHLDVAEEVLDAVVLGAEGWETQDAEVATHDGQGGDMHRVIVQDEDGLASEIGIAELMDEVTKEDVEGLSIAAGNAMIVESAT